MILRLHRPADGEPPMPAPVAAPTALSGGLHGGLELDQFFERQMAPYLTRRGRSPETLGEYRTHLRRWREYWDLQRASRPPAGRPGGKYRMTHPVLSAVTRAHLEAWQGWLGQVFTSLSARSINKHLASVVSVLRYAAELGLIAGAPRLPPLEARRAAPKITLSHEEVDRLYRACEVCTWPAPAPPRRSCEAGEYWRALIVMWCVYGARTQELVRYESRMRALTWGQVHAGERTPAGESRATSPHGWWHYTPQKQQRAKPELLVLPLVRTARAHLWAIRPAKPTPADEVWPWPMAPDQFYAQWERIVQAAKIETRLDLASGAIEPLQIKHLRKTGITWLEQHRPGVAGFVSGHAERDRERRVLSRHYLSTEQIVLEALATLPLPESFQEIFRREQRRLFD